jgi:hypothetical protein
VDFRDPTNRIRPASKSAVAGAFIWLLLAAPIAHAGFGITPPYLKNDRLTRGSSFTQEIIIVRGDPVETLNASVSVNVPGANDWISIDRGREFELPAGKRQVPITLKAQVPDDAEYKTYDGTVRIRTTPQGTPEGGQVRIALGAQVDVELEVTDEIKDFKVERVQLEDLEAGYKRWSLYFPGKIRFNMEVNNTGNVAYGPSRVVMDIFDAGGDEKITTLENRNELATVPAFQTEEITAEFPTRLSPGRYTARYKIYKEDAITARGQLTLSVSPYGSIQGNHGYGIWGLSWTDKAKLVGVILLLIVVLSGTLWFVIRTIRRSRAVE